MLDSVPHGGDAYLLKSVLLDEDDAKVRTILEACRSAIGASGRLIIIERLVGEPNRRENYFLDMSMLVTFGGGRERTLEEFSALLADSGFRLEQSAISKSPFTLLICAPV